jgi:hypothetical protein
MGRFLENVGNGDVLTCEKAAKPKGQINNMKQHEGELMFTDFNLLAK